MEWRRGGEEATEGLQRFPYLAQSPVRSTGFLAPALFTTAPPWGREGGGEVVRL